MRQLHAAHARVHSIKQDSRAFSKQHGCYDREDECSRHLEDGGGAAAVAVGGGARFVIAGACSFDDGAGSCPCGERRRAAAGRDGRYATNGVCARIAGVESAHIS